MRSITVITAFLFAIIGLNAQLGEQVMLKAKVVDVTTGKPMSIELEFKPDNGRKFVVKSQEESGTFDQLLQGSTHFEVTFDGDNVYRETIDYTTGSAKDGYSEITHTFKVKALKPGVKVDEMELFGPGNNDLTAAGKAALKKMKLSMRFNRNTSFIFKVNAPNQALADKRLNTLKDYISNWRRLLERVTFETGTPGNSVDVIVQDVEDIFK
jgi:hypothetical protein